MIFLSLLMCGCQNSTKLATEYNDFSQWETVTRKKLGIVFEAPKSRYSESNSSAEYAKDSGCASTSFFLHWGSNGGLTEDSYGIHVVLEVLTPESWRDLEKGESSPLSYGGHYGPYEFKFCPNYYRGASDLPLYANGNHPWGKPYFPQAPIGVRRRDIRASDGRVAVATAVGEGWDVGRDGGGEADEAAMRRIIESVRFINP